MRKIEKVKVGVTILVLIGILWMISGCVSASDYKKMETKYRTELQALNNQRQALANEKSKLEIESQKINLQLSETQTENDALKKKLAAEQEARAKLTEDVISRLRGISGVEVTDEGAEIQNEVLFDAGRAELKESGKKVLSQVAEVFQKHPDYLIRVEGHTDNDPISQSKTLWTSGSNFELAAGRALKVLLYLEEQGIDSGRMYLCSFGEHRPKKANDTMENKAQNRRVLIGFVPIRAKEPTNENSDEEKNPPAQKPPEKTEEMHK